ncbi:MAG: hypothetical protein M1142_03100 [Patescibacteria group bacterium]|nr:hypothetical protein [Patescibacteria group bacterium]
MEDKNWSISELYSKSWQIIKDNKILWLFGMAAVGLSSGSSRTNIKSGDIDSIRKFFQNNDPGTTSNKITQVLGASTDTFAETIKNLFFAVPIWVYVLLGLGILLLILANIILGIIYQAWANGALIAGVNAGAVSQKPTISQSSNNAFPAIKGLIWLNIIPTLIFFLITAVVLVILILGIVLLPSFSKAIPIILTVIAVIGAFIGWLLLTLTQIWASRRVVIDGKPGKQSFLTSFKLAKGRFWKMLGLGIVNILISLAVGFIIAFPLLIAGGITIFSVLFSKSNSSLLGFAILSVIVTALIYIFISPILFGILNSFKATVWTLAYNKIKGEYDE